MGLVCSVIKGLNDPQQGLSLYLVPSAQSTEQLPHPFMTSSSVLTNEPWQVFLHKCNIALWDISLYCMEWKTCLVIRLWTPPAGSSIHTGTVRLRCYSRGASELHRHLAWQPPPSVYECMYLCITVRRFRQKHLLHALKCKSEGFLTLAFLLFPEIFRSADLSSSSSSMPLQSLNLILSLFSSYEQIIQQSSAKIIVCHGFWF